MRICIPTEGKEGIKANVYGHFGSAPYFTIYDAEKETVKIIDNTNSHHEHGMCNPIGIIGASNVDAVVCHGMGARAVQKLNESKIKVFLTVSGTVSETIKQYNAGKLKEMTAENACAGHGCH